MGREDNLHCVIRTPWHPCNRYVAEGSIEERMLLLQAQKQKLLSAAFETRSTEDQRQMRINDVRLLMEL